MKALQNIRDYFAFKQNFSNFKRGGVKFYSPVLIISLLILFNNELMSQCPPEKTCFNNLIKNEGFEIDCVPGAGIYIDPFNFCLSDWKKGQGTPHLITTPFPAAMGLRILSSNLSICVSMHIIFNLVRMNATLKQFINRYP